MPFDSILAVEQIERIREERGDVRIGAQNLVWVNRVASVPAEDSEIMGYYTSRMGAAAIISDDAKAPLRAFPSIRLEREEIPNYKHGFAVPQSRLNLLHRIEAGLATANDQGFFGSYLQNQLDKLERGVWERIEWVILAMLLDTLTYDDNGVKLSMTFGMPSDLKVTPGTPWSTAASATPIDDIQSIRRVAREEWGVMLNRMTLSTASFNYMVATTQFKNMAQLYSSITFPASTFPTQDVALMTRMAGTIFGDLTIEIDDRQFWVENPDGTQTATRFQPATVALLTDSRLDGDSEAYDFGNGIVTESQPGMVPQMIGGEGAGERRGPWSYFTGGDPQGNPPGLYGWSVGRGFPRKHLKPASAILVTHS